MTCLDCHRLGRCSDTDVKKVVENYRCDRWEEAPQEIVQARIVTVSRYGPEAIQSLITLEEDRG